MRSRVTRSRWAVVLCLARNTVSDTQSRNPSHTTRSSVFPGQPLAEAVLPDCGLCPTFLSALGWEVVVVTNSSVPPVVPRSVGTSSPPSRVGTPSAGPPQPLPAPELAALPHQPELLCRIASVDSQDGWPISPCLPSGGALALRPRDLEPQSCQIVLREKGETWRWQPVSPTLMTHLRAHAKERGAPRDAQLLRYRTGEPITYRRYDYLWKRLGAHLPWVATQQISTHWLRHTTLTWVERNYGYAVARAFAGHTDSAGGDGTTTTYVRAGLGEVAAALAGLTGEPHPLAPGSHPQ
jgi:integrase